ncbi:hypothetical protein [Paenibacillus graminis]|uniref:hypothetical protein n=1 Tax=Paenibacillus graminis TaxID=189425 RepID=UPI000A540830|nr:hypothetical protein [Paenibacillus graminis]
MSCCPKSQSVFRIVSEGQVNTTKTTPAKDLQEQKHPTAHRLLIVSGQTHPNPSKPASGSSTTAFLPFFHGKPASGAVTTAFLLLLPAKPAYASSTTAFLPFFQGKPASGSSTTAFLLLLPVHIRPFDDESYKKSHPA